MDRFATIRCSSVNAIAVKRSGDARLGLPLGRFPSSVTRARIAPLLVKRGHVGSVCGEGRVAFLANLRQCFGIEAMRFASRLSGLSTIGGTGGCLVHIVVYAVDNLGVDHF